MSRHAKALDQYGGRYQEHLRLSIADLEYPMDWAALVFRLARRRVLPDLRGWRQ